MTDDETHESGRHGDPRVRLPGFVSEESVGLGDVVKRATTGVGIRPCGRCAQRAQRLNGWLVFSGRKSPASTRLEAEMHEQDEVYAADQAVDPDVPRPVQTDRATVATDQFRRRPPSPTPIRRPTSMRSGRSTHASRAWASRRSSIKWLP